MASCMLRHSSHSRRTSALQGKATRPLDGGCHVTHSFIPGDERREMVVRTSNWWCSGLPSKATAFPAGLISAVTVSALACGLMAATPAPRAAAVPAPEIEYTYNVTVRRHYAFPGNDALGYGFGICDKVGRGAPYADVMRDVKADVSPNDEFAANYLVSYAVGILCPAQIWQLRNTAAGYRPPA